MIKNTSNEVVIIALIVFVGTMLIKIPIKKKTSKLVENKRKLWNSLSICGVVGYINFFI